MAYGTSVSPIGSKPIKKKRPPNVNASGMLVSKRADGTIVSKDSGLAVAASRGTGGYTTTNKTNNARANLKYRERVTSKGVVHDYPGTKNDTLVKKPKKLNPGRKLY